MLKTIKSLSEYEQLYNEYVTEGHVRGYLNYFISKKNISAYINEEKIKYAVVDGTLFLFADQGNYYKMYFWRLTAKTKSLPDADKEICSCLSKIIMNVNKSMSKCDYLTEICILYLLNI